MTTRRSFFKLLAGVAPALFLTKLIVPTFKQTLKYGWSFETPPYYIEMPYSPYQKRLLGVKWEVLTPWEQIELPRLLRRVSLH